MIIHHQQSPLERLRLQLQLQLQFTKITSRLNVDGRKEWTLGDGAAVLIYLMPGPLRG